MNSLRWCIAICSLASSMATAADESTRDALKKERAAIESEYAAKADSCRHQFVVTPCLDKVRIDKQKALAGVRDREAALDAQTRRARAEAREQRLADKAAGASASAPVPSPRASSAATPKPAARARVKPAPKAQPSPQERADREQKQRADFEARKREIEAHRAEVEKRNADRARRKPAKPLPVPASGAT